MNKNMILIFCVLIHSNFMLQSASAASADAQRTKMDELTAIRLQAAQTGDAVREQVGKLKAIAPELLHRSIQGRLYLITKPNLMSTWWPGMYGAFEISQLQQAACDADAAIEDGQSDTVVVAISRYQALVQAHEKAASSLRAIHDEVDAFLNNCREDLLADAVVEFCMSANPAPRTSDLD